MSRSPKRTPASGRAKLNSQTLVVINNSIWSIWLDAGLRARRLAAGLDQDRDFRGYGAHPPQANWPGGARIAVIRNLNVDAGGERSILEGAALASRAGIHYAQ